MKKQEELYSFPQQNDGAVVETDIRMIPLSELHDFNGHPFKVENDMALFELMQSVEKEGVIVPALSKIVAIQTDSIDEPQATVVSEETSVEIPEIEEIKSEDTEVISEIIDYTKLSIEERALLLPVPTDDYKAEYNAYCQRMGYTEEKVSSIRYKMSLYDEFMEEYEYRKKYFGVEEVRTKEEQKKVIKER